MKKKKKKKKKFSHTPKWLTRKKLLKIGEVTKWVYETLSLALVLCYEVMF